jgi:hypothetical protein
MDQGPNPCFNIAPIGLDGVQFIFLLKLAGDLVEAPEARHGYLVLLARDAKAPIGISAWRRSEYEKIFQIAALLVLASGGAAPLRFFAP